MENAIIIAILVVLIGGAIMYILKAKKNGVKCIGCSSGGSCSSSCNCGCGGDDKHKADSKSSCCCQTDTE